MVKSKTAITIYTRIPLVNTDHTAYMLPIGPKAKLTTGTRGDFLIINREHPHYSTISYKDLNNFIYVSNMGYISSQRHIEIYMHDTIHPEENLMRTLIERAERNGYLFKLSNDTEGVMRCQENVTKITIPKLSFIHVPEHCALTSPCLLYTSQSPRD